MDTERNGYRLHDIHIYIDRYIHTNIQLERHAERQTCTYRQFDTHPKINESRILTAMLSGRLNLFKVHQLHYQTT